VGDPIWLDTNTLDQALKGDPAINDQLAGFRRSGRQLLVTERVETELLYGNDLTIKKNKPFVKQIPEPQFRAQMKKGMNKIGVEVDTRARSIPIERLYQYRSIKATNVSESDRRVLSEIKASAEARGIAAPEIITVEKASKAMSAHSSAWRIKSVPAAVSKPGVVPEYPRVNLADYPEDREGEISRFFKDRPVLKKLTLIGGTVAAQEVSSKMLSEVFEHFNDALARAGQAFEAKHPDPTQMRSKARIDDYKRAYEAALSNVNLPTKLKVGEAVILAFTPDRDIDKTKAYLDAQIAKVASAADGRLIGFAQAAGEYIDAMTSLYKQIGAASLGLLPDIAADIEKRGQVVFDAGVKLDETFWRVLPIVAAFPIAYYEWLNVKSVADSFDKLGSSLLGFAGHISARQRDYEAALKRLDDELIKVSEQAAKF
jgi:hypothetical protein